MPAKHEEYIALEAREASFTPAIRTSKKSGRSTKVPSGSATTAWPHPESFIAGPKSLARAGFFYDGDPNGRDRVTCFSCAKSLEGWEVDDDPFEQHARSKDCAWAKAVCVVESYKKMVDGEVA
jgi:hypothetical protein